MSRFVDIAGRRVHVDVAGSGPTVVLEAGGIGQGVGRWPTVEPQLTNACAVVTYDRLGAGESAAAAPGCTIDGMVATLRTLLSELQVTTPVVLVGWSFGGLVAELFALRHPDLVAGLVLVDPTPTSTPEGPWLTRVVAPRISVANAWLLYALSASRVFETPPGRRLAGSLARRMTTGAEAAEAMAGALRNSTALKANVGLLRSYRRDVAIVAQALRTSTLPEVPLTVITAGQRPAGSAKQAAGWAHVRASHQELANSVPGGRLVVAEKSGHLVPVEQPDVIVRAVADTLAGLP